MKSLKTVVFSLALVFSLGLATGCTPSVEDLCSKAEGDEAEDCAEELNKAKEKLGDDLWKELAKCLDDKDKIDRKAFGDCLTDDMKEKFK